MGLFGFKRYEGPFANYQKFYDDNLPVCPLCRTDNPYWTLKDKSGFGTYRVLCRCKHCKGIISATRDDISGKDMKKTPQFSTNGLMTTAIKMDTIYLKVENLGNSNASKDLKGKEFALEELQEMAQKF